MSWIFSKIYQDNLWKSHQSASGTGSELVQTRYLVAELPRLIERLQIQSILDIPCGDFNWMKQVELSEVRYIGGDIVPEVIQSNREKYGSNQFQLIDLSSDTLPSCDLLLCRDCLVHFSYYDIAKALTNIIASETKFVWLTTFPEHENQDIVTGAWRPINLQAPPFNFPAPMELFNEQCTEGTGQYHDKSMGLWHLSDLRGLDFSGPAFKQNDASKVKGQQLNFVSD